MKRKVTINRPEISAQEIAQRKDFNSVLKNSSPDTGGKTPFGKPWFLSSLAVATLAVITTAVWLNRDAKPLAQKPVAAPALGAQGLVHQRSTSSRKAISECHERRCAFSL